MENLIIQKAALKFTVEITSKNGQVSFNVVRYIEVGKDESLAANAKLSKNDALNISGHFVNCNKLLKAALSGMESTMLPHTLNLKKTSNIRLKKSCTFGY